MNLHTKYLDLTMKGQAELPKALLGTLSLLLDIGYTALGFPIHCSRKGCTLSPNFQECIPSLSRSNDFPLVFKSLGAEL